MSGFKPLALVGISVSGKIIPIVPFWPALEQNLSPSAGFLIERILILAILVPFLPSVIKALSIIPVSPFLGLIESSFLPSSSPLPKIALPISIVFASIISPSRIKPLLSSFE